MYLDSYIHLCTFLLETGSDVYCGLYFRAEYAPLVTVPASCNVFRHMSRMASIFSKSFAVFFLSLLGCVSGDDASDQRTKVSEGMLWQRSAHQMASIEVNKEPISRLLASLLSYKFLLPLMQLRAGVAYTGPRTRLRRFVHDLLQGRRSLKIGAVGGR